MSFKSYCPGTDTLTGPIALPGPLKVVGKYPQLDSTEPFTIFFDRRPSRLKLYCRIKDTNLCAREYQADRSSDANVRTTLILN